MIRICIGLVERFVRPDLAAHITGDLIEQRERGSLWLFRETMSALWHFHARPHSGDGLVMHFLADLRVAARLLRRSPTFAIVSILTLGLAIGATASIFSVIEPVLLKPLPYANPDHLAFVWELDRDGSQDNIGYPTFRDLVKDSKTIERAAAIGDWQPTLSSHGEPERVQGDRVSWTYFRTLGVHPALGRDFTEDEDVPGHNQVVIVSHGLWQRRYGGDTSIIGKPISIGGNPYTIVGVMPASFDNAINPASVVWRPLAYLNQPFACRTCHHLRMLIRIRGDVSVAAATTELNELHHGLVREYPKEYASVGAAIVTVQKQITGAFRPALLALTGAVGLVLLIALANAVNLQLARAVRREEEFAIRIALGAAKSRLFAQLLTEALLLAALGGIAGVIVAAVSVPILVAHLPQGLPRLSAIHLDGGALAAIGAIVVVVALAIGLAPARRKNGDLGLSLRASRRTGGGNRHLTRAGLVAGEIALAMMLLVSGGLVARSLIRLLAVDPGFDATNLLSLEINAIGSRYAQDNAVYEYHRRVREAVSALPGVLNVATSNQLPMAGNVDRYGVVDPENVPANPELVPSGDRYVVSPEYLKAMRIPVLRGRAFTAQDAADTNAKIALISTALAQKLWPNQDAVGKRIRVGGETRPPFTVIGITGNVRHTGLDAAVTLQWYVPEGQFFEADGMETLIVRTRGDPAAMAATVRAAVAAIDPTQPIIKIATMDQLIAATTSQRRLAMVLFIAFATAALLLAIAGIYGVLAGSVAERTREIGVRSALGATPRDIIALVISQGGRMAAVGVILGLAGSIALTRFLQTLLFGIGRNDPVTLIGVAVLIGVVTLLACFIPASRAARVDPSRALRSE